MDEPDTDAVTASPSAQAPPPEGDHPDSDPVAYLLSLPDGADSSPAPDLTLEDLWDELDTAGGADRIARRRPQP